MVKEVIAGYYYSTIGIKRQARTRDTYSSDWSGRAIGTSHKYDGIEVKEDGKALVRNKYRKGLWD